MGVRQPRARRVPLRRRLGDRASARCSRSDPTGSDLSWDGGRTWSRFDTGSFDSVQCAGFGGCYASGELGRVAKLSW